MKFVLAVVISTVCLVSAWASPFSNHPSTRIVGGQDARAGQFPYAAAIYLTQNGGTYFCGGALIDTQHIVTAGHCVVNVTNFRIQLGSNHLSAADENREIFSTDTWFVHPDYDPITQDNDIGIIRLRQPITFNAYLRSINLPNVGLQNDINVQVLGWGQTNDEDSGLVDSLQYVQLVTISNPECQIFYGNQITSSMICAAGNLNEGTCNGDSGAPLIEQRGGVYLVGIANFLSANGCESTDPSGFVRVYSYVPWINNITSSTTV